MNPWLLAALCLLALSALAMLIRGVTRMLRDARLCAVPLCSSQQVEFPAAGRVVLCLEGPHFTPGFRRLRFELRQPGGAEIVGHRILFRTVASGISHARVTLRTYDLPMPGRHELLISGLAPEHVGAPGHSVVFMRPHLSRTLLFIIGITLASALAITSLVFCLLSVLPTAAAIDPGRCTGYVELHGSRVELREAFAHLHRGTREDPPPAPELRVVLSDREIAQESLAGRDGQRVLTLARAGEVQGILLRLNPDDARSLTLTVLEPTHAGANPPIARRYADANPQVLRNLRVSSQRVSGELTCPPGSNLECRAHFSAPIFTD